MWWVAFDIVFIVVAAIAVYRLELCDIRRSIVFPLLLIPLVSTALAPFGVVAFAGCCAVFYLSYKSNRMHNAPRWIKITLIMGSALCCVTAIDWILYYEYVSWGASIYYFYSELMALIMLSLLFAFVFPNGIGADEFRQRIISYWLQFRGRFSHRGNTSANKIQKLCKGAAQ